MSRFNIGKFESLFDIVHIRYSRTVSGRVGISSETYEGDSSENNKDRYDHYEFHKSETEIVMGFWFLLMKLWNNRIMRRLHRSK